MRRGDAVGVVAPGFAIRPTALRAGARRLRAMGLEPVLGEHVLARNGYLAGSDEQRAADLNAMVRRDDVRAIWFARGGYGTARLLERFAWRAYGRAPKPLIGYSDVTALFSAVTRRTSGICLYGPTVAELGDARAYHAPSLGSLLRGEPGTIRFRRSQVLVGGRARGRLLGGNLSVLASLWGTRFAPDLRGAVLFLEDVGEETYRLDRMLTQLRMTGALRDVRGIVVGGLEGAPRRRRFPPDRPALDVVREILVPLGVPLVVGLPAGHVAAKRTLALGGRAELDTRQRLLRGWPAPA